MRHVFFSVSLVLAAIPVCLLSGCATGKDKSGPVTSQAEWEKNLRDNYSDWKPSNVPPPQVQPQAPVEQKTVTAATSDKKTVAAPSYAAASKTYKTAQGDTLYSIAKKLYKDSSKWKLIYEANKNLLPTPESIKPGMELRIPPLK